jgi:hypothetical protein
MVRVRWVFQGGIGGFVLGEVAGLAIGGAGPCGISGWILLGFLLGPVGAVAYPLWKRYLLKRRPLEWGDGR